MGQRRRFNRLTNHPLTRSVIDLSHWEDPIDSLGSAPGSGAGFGEAPKRSFEDEE